jgi:hypothetical protein
VKPSHKAYQVQGDRRGDVLEVHLLQTEIASVAEVCDSYSLRNRAFDSCTAMITGLPILSTLLSAYPYSGFIGRLISYRELPHSSC